MTNKEIWLIYRSHVEGEQIVVFPPLHTIYNAYLNAMAPADLFIPWGTRVLVHYNIIQIQHASKELLDWHIFSVCVWPLPWKYHPGSRPWHTFGSRTANVRDNIQIQHNRNIRRDVTPWIGWQRSHQCHPVLTRQKRCFYKGQSITWARIFVVLNYNIKNLLG